MKIDLSHIVIEHVGTLRDFDSRKTSKRDLMLFYGIPLFLSAFILIDGKAILSKDACNVSVTFFGIFIPLLLNIQVAAFGIFQRKWNSPEDDRVAEILQSELDLRRRLLQD